MRLNEVPRCTHEQKSTAAKENRAPLRISSFRGRENAHKTAAHQKNMTKTNTYLSPTPILESGKAPKSLAIKHKTVMNPSQRSPKTALKGAKTTPKAPKMIMGVTSGMAGIFAKTPKTGTVPKKIADIGNIPVCAAMLTEIDEIIPLAIRLSVFKREWISFSSGSENKAIPNTAPNDKRKDSSPTAEGDKIAISMPAAARDERVSRFLKTAVRFRRW